jgi:hypothetical protein
MEAACSSEILVSTYKSTRRYNVENRRDSANKSYVLCDIAPCSLVEVDRRFRGAYNLQHQGDVSSPIVFCLMS